MKIHGLNKLTLLDYPGHMACLLFTGACNYRCPFCHNASLVNHPSSQPSLSEDEIFDFLKERQSILEGVCISGGEPTLQPDLIAFIRKIKELGYLVKLDTNGSRPGVLSSLLEEGLLDYVAMDIKNSPQKYLRTIGIKERTEAAEEIDRTQKLEEKNHTTEAVLWSEAVEDNLIIRSVKTSAKLLMSASIPYEFRTTVVRELHDPDDLLSIGRWLKGAKAYFLQNFRDADTLLGAEEGQFHSYEKKELEECKEQLQPFFETVGLRY